MSPSVASPSALHRAASVDRPIVVCLHSSGSSASQWKRLMEAQQGAYRFIACRLLRSRAQCPATPARTTHCSARRMPCGTPWHRSPARSTWSATPTAARWRSTLPSRFPDRVASVCVYEPVLFALLDPASDEFARDHGSGLGDRAQRARRPAGSGCGHVHRLLERAGLVACIEYGTAHRVARGSLRSRRTSRHCSTDPLPCSASASIESADSWCCRATGPRRRRGRSAGAWSRSTRLQGAVLSGLGHMGPVTHPEDVNRQDRRHLRDSSTLPIAA